MRREPSSMLHEVVNYKVKGTRPRGRPTRLKNNDNHLEDKRRDVLESVPGSTWMANILSTW